MNINTLKKRIHRKIWKSVVDKTKSFIFYPYLYLSYWNRNKDKPISKSDPINYFTAIPNPGAGIGHQMANWIAGYWFAKQFQLQFAHIPFSSPDWEKFLSFGTNEVKTSLLIEDGYKAVKIPLFDENNSKQVEQIKKIISSYQDKKVVFVAEQDQFYHDQFGIQKDLQQKFYDAPIRAKQHLVYSNDFYNIAIHVRRGDITIGQLNKNPNLLMRWQDNDYFVNTLKNVLKTIEFKKPWKIFLFSQGKRDDFQEFEQFENVEFCLDMGAQESFLHMVYADILITSKSSFSYKPALLNKGLIFSPKNFWHGYPNSKNWILTDEQGNFTLNEH